jgi:hypothetical protein
MQPDLGEVVIWMPVLLAMLCRAAQTTATVIDPRYNGNFWKSV